MGTFLLFKLPGGAGIQNHMVCLGRKRSFGWCSADEVWLKNGDRLTGKVLSLEEGTLLFSTTFRVNLGAGFATGNTDKEDIYADGEFVARTDHNRYTIGGLYRRAESDNVKTEDKSLG